jgi:hypothetical protein
VPTHENRRDLLRAMMFAVGSLLVVRLSVLFVLADAFRADETGTAATGVLPMLGGAVVGIALLTASVWHLTAISDRSAGVFGATSSDATRPRRPTPKNRVV